MSSTSLRSLFAGLTSCVLLVFLSACGTEKSSSKSLHDSPSTWSSSTWKFETSVDEIATVTFSGQNSGRFTGSYPNNISGNIGSYTYSKTGQNTATIVFVFDPSSEYLNRSVALHLVFRTAASGDGSGDYAETKREDDPSKLVTVRGPVEVTGFQQL